MTMSKNVQELVDKLIGNTTTDQSENFPIYVNGVQLPPHTSFKVSYDDLYDDAWRDNLGFQHGDLIRKNVRKLSIEFKMLTKEDAQGILNAVSQSQYIEVSYPDDPLTGTRHTITCYVGAKDIVERGTSTGKTVWESISFNLIER